MFKFSSQNKETKNLSNVLLSQNTLRKKPLSNKSNKGVPSAKKNNLKLKKKFYSDTKFFGKQDESHLNCKKPLEGPKQAKTYNRLPHPSSFYQDENKVKLRNEKLKFPKGNPLTEASTNSQCPISESKSNLIPQQPGSQISQALFKIPPTFKLNINDLRLKAPLVKKSFVRTLKAIRPLGNDKCIGGDDKNFAFPEEKWNRFPGLKNNTISKDVKEAFDIFSFPVKRFVDKHSVLDMGSMNNSASVCVPHQDINIKLKKEENNLLSNKTNTIVSKITPQYSFQTKNSNENTEAKINYLEEINFASPILGNEISAVGSESNVFSPVLDSKVNNTSKLQRDKAVQSKKYYLSPILNRNERSLKDRIPYFKMNSINSNTTFEKPNVNIGQSERDNINSSFCPRQKVGSQALECSQWKKEKFLQKCKTDSCKSHMISKLDEEELSPSPVLDASQFKKPIGLKLKKLPVGKSSINPTFEEVIPCISYLKQNSSPCKVDCGTNNKGMQIKEHYFERAKGLEEEPSLENIESKGERNCDLTRNEGGTIDRLKLNSLEETSEPQSQVLGSNQVKDIWSQDISIVEPQLKTTQKSVCLAIVSEASISHHQSTSEFKNAGVSESIGKNKVKIDRHNLEGLFSHDELLESCSPILRSSHFKQTNFSAWQTERQSSKCQERTSKVWIGSKSSKSKNHCDHNESEFSQSYCNKKSNIMINVPMSTKEFSSSISLSDFGNLMADSVPCNQSKASTNISKRSFTDSTALGLKSAECYPNHSVSKYPKRIHTPITDSKLKLKKQKCEVYEGKIKHLEPMLGKVSMSPVSDDLCLSASNLNQDDIFICPPSLNSDLDIRKFPIMLPNFTYQYSPKERSEKLLTEKNVDIVMSSQKYFEGRHDEKGLLLKYPSKDEIKSHIFDKSKLLPAINQITKSMLVTDTLSPILSRSEGFQNPNFPLQTNAEVNLSNKGETHITSQFTENYSHSNKYFGSQDSGKRHVKKNLALYYEKVNPETRSMNDKLSTDPGIKNAIETHSKNEETLDNEGMVCESQISGVGKLQTLPCEYADCDKLLINSELQNNQGQMLLMPKNEEPHHKWVKRLEPSSSNLNVQTTNPCKNFNTESKRLSYWKNELQLFDDNEEICIEEFDEETPLGKESVEVTIHVSNLESVKRNLNLNFEQGASCNVITKQVDPEVKGLLQNFEPDGQTKNSCEYMSSEESSCDIEIQEDFSQRTSERSPVLRIEYSTTPTTKSTEETLNEACSNPPSFPPALEVETNTSPSAGVIDSACKNRRTRVKIGSAVERLRRLVRGQRAEVNMFHHEAVSTARARARACSLSVTSATKTCSMLMLNCRYIDTHRATSQELGSGEEVVDPQVHVYVDPSYAKNITAGCTVTIFPPWHSVWHESRGVIMMYCVTKLQLETHNQSCPEHDVISFTKHPNSVHTTLVEFSCQFQDEQCGCRNQLISQLFTAPPQAQGEPSGGAEGGITAALAGGWFLHRVKLRLRVLHSFQTRGHHNQLQTRILCVDAIGHICQLNLRSEQDKLKLGPLKEAHNKIFVMKNLTVCRRIFIDRCKGLRSFLTYLHADSTKQLLLYVATPASDEWTVHLIDETAESHTTADIHSRITSHHQQLLSLPTNEEVEGRARARVQVMAVRRDELFVWYPQLDSYFKINITSSAAIPNFPARAYLDLKYIWAHQGELTIDKFTEVSIVEDECGDSPTIPSLSTDSTEGNLVLLDSVLTKVDSEAYLRWEGNCGHKVLRVQKSGLYYCITCRETSASSIQKVVLEVCVAVVDIPHPIRVKVKSETARILLADMGSHISTEKSYNVIGAIGSNLKCLAVVKEVLRNSFGDIIEFILEEL